MLFKTLLYLHILTGSISLLVGLIVILLKKGNNLHKKLGSLFYYSMIISSLVAIPMSIIHPNYFLFAIAIFTLYLLVSAKRYLSIKTSKNIHLFDKILMITMLIFSLAFISFGFCKIVINNYFGFVFLFFGLIGLVNLFQDYQALKDKLKTQNFGLVIHIQRMVGGYIATTTAFLVVNNKFLPEILVWLLPTLCFVPLQIYWTKKYEKRKKNST